MPEIVMKKALDINTVYQCNRMLSGESLHPLVSVIDLSKAGYTLCNELTVGFYSVVMKEYRHENYQYGRKKCDYSDATVVFLSPGDCLDTENNHASICNEGWMLVFHPEFIRNTSLGLHIRDYSFLSYNKEEALHISEREKKVLIKCLEHAGEELNRSIDKHSRMLVVKSIELLLGYCTRFYERQFIVRNEENKRIMKKTEQLVNDFFVSLKVKTNGLPTAHDLGGMLGLSATYFSDLLKHETGLTVSEYVETKRIDLAKRWLSETDMSVDQVATKLGYVSAEYLTYIII